MTIVAEIKERGFDGGARVGGRARRRRARARRGRPGEVPREALLALADRVRRWHEAQRPADISLEVEPGVTLERRWVPLDTVGIYVPRNLISTLVMCAVPAQAAGVRRIVVCTPPQGAGLVAAAAEVLGLDEVWALGGPQAIGWLAYVERVDKIVGPGNQYVNDAKLEVSARRRRSTFRAARPRWSCSATATSTAADRARARRAARARSRRRLPERGDARGGGGDRARAPRAARRRRGARGRRSATRARSSSGRGRRSPRATTRRAATTSCRRTAGRARSAGSASRPSSSR